MACALDGTLVAELVRQMSNDQLSRGHHFVPEWYQRLFLPGHKGNLIVLDKAPVGHHTTADGRVRTYATKEILSKGPGVFLRVPGLYMLEFFGEETDVIERVLFGGIDRKGARAAKIFAQWPSDIRLGSFPDIPEGWGDPGERMCDLIEYMDAQKVRTPKALDFFKQEIASSALSTNKNGLLLTMQQWRQFYATMFSEALWEIVTPAPDAGRFIFSDDPVTFYNCDRYPGTAACSYPNDPHIFELGTRVLFPLGPDACLILTHVDHAKKPLRSRARRMRRNARSYDQTLMSFLDIHRERQLCREAVASINFVIKRRAVRYVASSVEEDLFPERVIGEPRWCTIDSVLQHEGSPHLLSVQETVIKYRDETVVFSNPYGERQVVPGWFVKGRRSNKRA